MLTLLVAAALASGPEFSLRDGDVAVPVTAYALPEAPAPSALTVCDVQWRMRSGADPVRSISGCDGAWRDAVDKASAAWVLAPSEAALREGDAVRHATFYAWPDGAVRVALWGTRASEQTPLPAGVVYGRQPDATKRYPLEIPDELKVGVEAVDCRVRMSVDLKGKPTAIEGADCPTALRDDAVKLVSQWRFAPALVDEKPVPAPYYVAARWRKPAPPPPPLVYVDPEADPVLPEGVAFRLHHGSYDKVDVTAWAMPAPMAGGLQHCDAAFRLTGPVTQITVDGCAGPFAAAVESAASKWKFGPPELKEGQPYTTFRVSFYAFPDGHVRTVLWNTLEGDQTVLPEGVVYGTSPGVGTFVAPKYPDNIGGERLTVHCLFAVSLDERGSVLGITPESCDEPWLTPALAALAKWDFKPAKVEDVKVPHTWHNIDVRFSPDPTFP